MRILVTGATGVIGRRAVPLLIEDGHAVTAAGRSRERLEALERAGATPRTLDLFDPAATRAAVAGHDAVVNLATHIPPPGLRMLLRRAWRENDRIRTEGSRILVDAALDAGVERFVQESFAPIYADGGDSWIDETWPVAPVRYNRSVLDAERSAERFTAGGGAGVVLRFSAFYGPDAGQTRELVRAVRKGWAPLPGGPDGFVSSISHDDAATAVVTTLGVPAGIYDATDDEPVRRRALVDSLAAALGVPAPRLPPAWAGRLMGSLGEMLARSLRISNRKLREASGWAPRYPSLREGWASVVGAA